MEDPKKKTVTTVATVLPGIVATIRNLKKKKRKKKKKGKMPHQISTIDEQWKHIEWIVLKYCSGIAKKVQTDD